MIEIKTRNAGYIGFPNMKAIYSKYMWKKIQTLPNKDEAEVIMFTGNPIKDASKVIKMGYEIPLQSCVVAFVYNMKLKKNVFAGTIQEVADQLEVSGSAVSGALNGRQATCGGFIIHRGGEESLQKKLSQYNPKKSRGVKRRVMVYYNEKMFGIFESVTEAADKTGVGRSRISACLGKKQTQANGYKFRYYGN